VRNRAKEIAELLSDVERIRGERRKARANKQKYQGASNSDFIPGSGTGRYGGFGSDSAFSGGFNGGGGGGGGSSSATQRESFDEYDAGDDDDARSKPAAVSSSRRGGQSSRTTPAPPKKQEKVVDLFSFDDDEPAPAPAVKASGAAQPPADAFDDFDDFQAAPSAPAANSKPATSGSSGAKGNVFDFLGDGGSAAIPSATSARPPLAATPLSPSTAPIQPQRADSSTSMASAGAPPAPAKGNNASLNFDDLWASSAGKSASAISANKGKMTMSEMAKQKSNSAVWGGTPQQKKSDPFDFL